MCIRDSKYSVKVPGPDPISIIVLLDFEIIKSEIFFRKFLSKIKFCPSDFLVFIDNLSIFYIGFNSNIS